MSSEGRKRDGLDSLAGGKSAAFGERVFTQDTQVRTLAGGGPRGRGSTEVVCRGGGWRGGGSERERERERERAKRGRTCREDGRDKGSDMQ